MKRMVLIRIFLLILMAVSLTAYILVASGLSHLATIYIWTLYLVALAMFALRCTQRIRIYSLVLSFCSALLMLASAMTFHPANFPVRSDMLLTAANGLLLLGVMVADWVNNRHGALRPVFASLQKGS